MKVSQGRIEDGIVVGNTYDKYGTKNPIARKLMHGFHSSLETLVEQCAPTSIHEVGCGEGFLAMEWQEQGIDVRGSDFSTEVIEIARENARSRNLPDHLFTVRSIYDLAHPQDSANLVVCCEVLEHLEDPVAGLEALKKITEQHLIISVPREPIWSVLNMARGKYWSDFGNTPGHIQNWSRAAFVELVGSHFEVQRIESPLPWTMLLCAR